MTDPRAAASPSVAGADGAARGGWSSDPDSPATTLHPALTTALGTALEAERLPGRPPVVPGHVSIAPRVLQKVGGAVVAETLRVERHDVRVEARDDESRLSLRVQTPLAIPPLSAATVAPPGGVVGTVRALQETVTRRIGEITGRAVSRVDVTITASSPITREVLR